MTEITEIPEKSGALHGIRVIDATQMLAGPLAAMRLGDLGADVIKIEAPLTGEFNRTHGYADVELKGQKTTFLGLNRNKRSLAIDLKLVDGRELFYDLVKSSDILVQNFRVGTVERLGIDYQTLKAINPRLIYASITGYGPDGPGAGRPGQDLVLQGYSGSMWFVGSQFDAPTPGGIPSIDAMTGYQATIGILAALHARSITGVGQHVEVDMLSVVMDAQIQELTTYLNSGVVPRRGVEYTAHAWIGAPYGVYKTSDGWLTLAMCPIDVLGQALGDERLVKYNKLEDAQKYTDEIYAIIRPQFTDRTTNEWITRLDQFNIWSGPVYDYPELEQDEQVTSRGLIVEIEHPTVGRMRTVAPPIRMSENPTSIRRAAPLLGADTRRILSEELGYSEQYIEDLVDRGVVKVDNKEVI